MWPCSAIIRIQLLGREGENVTYTMTIKSGARVKDGAIVLTCMEKYPSQLKKCIGIVHTGFPSY